MKAASQELIATIVSKVQEIHQLKVENYQLRAANMLLRKEAKASTSTDVGRLGLHIKSCEG